ncbi:MAG: hypothetical protein WC428_08420 [Candidatus Paceibacterota bacterium]
MYTITEKEKTDLLKLDELDSYFFVDECGAFIWRMNHDMADDRIPQESHKAIDEDIVKIRELQKFVVNNLTRFGVDPESVTDRKNGSYWKWYMFWDTWKKGLSNEDWNEVSMLLQKKKPLDNFLPTGTWKDFVIPE